MEDKQAGITPPTREQITESKFLFSRLKKHNILYIFIGTFFLCIIVLYLAYSFGEKNTSLKQIALQNKSGIQSQTSNAQTNLGNSLITPTLQSPQAIDVHVLPLGDCNVSTSPKICYIYSCMTQFKMGGSSHTGNWITGNTWDLTKKIHVEGTVNWPLATFSVTTSGNNRFITGNGLPVNTLTGIFPIQPTDPAYQVDRNPNSIRAQNISLTLPLNPQIATTPSCVPMGMIGVAINGVAIFNGLDASGRDAVAHEVQDSCDGHPESTGQYHYHGPSSCIPEEKENNKLIGYADDGYGIYSMYDANGKEYTDADLDACHGITSPVLWNDKIVNMYHYVLTQEYPYTVGCFRGSVVDHQLPMGTRQGDMQRPIGNRPWDIRSLQ